MKRVFDVLFALPVLVLTAPLFVIIGLLIKCTSRGPVFHASRRVGRDNRPFRMLKFRTMKHDAPQLPTHLVRDPGRYVTAVGRFLRLTSLDELPQLLHVLSGRMSLVGPRPALFNQDDLVALRTQRGVHRLVPGITGWAQTHGRDEIPIPRKVELDAYYLEHRGLALDLKILWLTLLNVLRRDGVAH